METGILRAGPRPVRRPGTGGTGRASPPRMWSTPTPPEGVPRLVLPRLTHPLPALLLLALPLLALPLLVVAALPGSLGAQGEEGRWREARLRMVREQIAEPRDGRPPVRDRAVLRAMRSVPRHAFVPEPWRARAYGDHPLPIGHDQTISQPYIVARMTALLELEPGEKVLEVGTGSGYQAAVLAEITDSVYSVEIVGELARSARERLRRLGYGTVRVRHGDGYGGWPEHAPFDAIVVTAAPEETPPRLVEQLAPGGRMVLPRGPTGGVQWLVLLRKRPDGEVEEEILSGVRFVPMIRGEDTVGVDADAEDAERGEGEEADGRGVAG